MAAIDNFRKNLSSACDRKGWSQQELARRSSVHYVTVNRILRGKICPTIPVAERLAKAVGVPLEKFLSRHG